MNHPFHESIGDALRDFFKEKKNYVAELDIACTKEGDKRQWLSLFIDKKRLKTRMCCVDAMVLKDGYPRIIIEIEESNYSPTHVCGKFLTSFISNKYSNKKFDSKSIWFIQIINGKDMSDDKKEQLTKIGEKIREIHKNYRIIIGKKDAIRKKLNEILCKICK